ncbi:MAG TPA: TolC family protein [Vicinamibacterales bacterium]|nr:TolC family protein [Vicinamibacterales bacterium]
MRARACSICVVVLLLSAPATAQVVLSEADALAKLSPDSPRVKAIRAQVEIARADVIAASRWPNPRVTYDRESVAGVTEGMTMIAQPLPISGRRGLEAMAASALVDSASQRASDELRRVRADLRLAYAALQASQMRETEIVRARDHLQEFAAVLQRREAAGDAAGFDRLRAEREVLELEADRVSASVERGRAQAALAAFFSEAVDPSTIAAAAATMPPPVLPAIDAMFERAQTVRGELLAFQHEVSAARLQLQAADRRVIPEPEVLGGTKSSSAAPGEVGGVFSVQATIPLFDRANAERALARARGAQAQARADAFRLALRSQLAALRAAAEERRAAAEHYRSVAVAGADQLERIAQVSYDAGERGILELLDAYRLAASARVRLSSLDFAAREAEVELEFVSGWEIP